MTNPFIEILTLKKIYRLLKNNSKIDSVTPVYPIYNRLWYKKKPINHKYHKLIGTQFMEPVLVESGVYCFRKEIFKSC